MNKGYDIPELRDGFAGDAIASWAVTAVTGAGVMDGVNPQDDATRADAAQALMCFLRFVAEELPAPNKTASNGAPPSQNALRKNSLPYRRKEGML